MSSSPLSPTSPQRYKNLILCFDGTSNKFDEYNTNVVKLFSLLKKDEPKRQKVYYQTGVGTYTKAGTFNPIALKLSKIADLAIACFLDMHVMGGYKFLMKHYEPGDRICLFGFSRGAYTARALAGMLHQVGLLPEDNNELVAFAYKSYRSSPPEHNLAFKKAFSQTIPIEFVGLWDTVSSVGLLFNRHLPFTDSNHIIKAFRHAVSLDEHRARFQQNLWHRRAPDNLHASLDPERGSGKKEGDSVAFDHEGDLPTRHKQKPTDIKEVWFAGCHTDVGGGSVRNTTLSALSSISLRWMIRECANCQTGILFDRRALRRAGIPDDSFRLSTAFDSFKRIELPRRVQHDTETLNSPDSAYDPETNGDSTAQMPHPERAPITTPPTRQATTAGNTGAVTFDPILLQHGRVTTDPHSAEHHYRMSVHEHDHIDALGTMHDQLSRPVWWLLEFIPYIDRHQDKDGRWLRSLRINLFRPRRTFEDVDQPIKVHHSVKRRMEAGVGYQPRLKWKTEPEWIE